MSIVSLSFPVFLIVFGLLYFLLPKKIQWVVLLGGSLFFYACSGVRYLIYPLGCAFVSWFAALQVEKNNTALKAGMAQTGDKEEKAELRKNCEKKNRLWTGAAISLVLGIWILLKYVPFFLDSLASLFRIGSLQSALKFIVPLGMSFYTFDAIGYLLDVSHGRHAADKNFFRYLTFVSCFLHIIQGPFSRYGSLGKTLFEGHRFSFGRLCEGCSRILWGYFKKLIVADKLAAAVSEVFSNYADHWGINILAAILLYGIQIYADFSGYMDIVCGISRILGIGLEENFSRPYFSRSLEEFWRRWHMTLGHWFRDHVFFPVSRSEKAREIRRRFPPETAKHLVSFMAMFCVWSASGLWHGANWTFLIWGWLNMIIMLGSQILEPQYRRWRETLGISAENRAWDLFRIIRTFFIVCMLFSVIRADSLHSARCMFLAVFSGFNRKLLLHPLQLFPKMSMRDVLLAMGGAFMMFIADLLCETGKWEAVKEKTPFFVRSLFYTVLIFILILFAGTGGDITANFIYANF